MHAGRERHRACDLREAPEATVVTHEADVVTQGEHRTRAEGMPVDRGDRRHRQLDKTGEDFVDAVDIRREGTLGAPRVLDIQTVGVELPGTGGDERRWAARGLEFVDPNRYMILINLV